MSWTTKLQFLTEEDQRVLFEKASHESFNADEVILEEGSPEAALYFIRKGAVRVEREHLGSRVPIAALGEGEIFGEISFLEQRGASASVVADESVEVDVVEGAKVHSLLFSVPGLSSRFFQSLALALSERLRQTTDQFVSPYSWG